MALSCYSSSNWELDQLNSDLNQPDEDEAEYFPDILGLNNNYYHYSLPFSDSHNVSDPFLVPSHDFCYPENHYPNSYSNTLYSIFPETEFEPSFSTKRQKGRYDACYVNSSIEVDNRLMLPSLSNGIGIVEQDPPSLLSPEIVSPFGSSPANNNPPVFSSASSGSNGGVVRGTLSSQSIAARQRRRKISDKTQELGKLIPGGQKMNTAEMFQAASKYIKFLQAQVGILQSLASVDEDKDNGESFHCEELNRLLESSLIHDKLYSMEKCLVPEKHVQSIANDVRIQANCSGSFKDLIGGG